MLKVLESAKSKWYRAMASGLQGEGWMDGGMDEEERNTE